MIPAVFAANVCFPVASKLIDAGVLPCVGRILRGFWPRLDVPKVRGHAAQLFVEVIAARQTRADLPTLGPVVERGAHPVGRYLGRQFAIDGGTGVRLYGDTLMRQLPIDMDVLMTHLHLDHVQGFPFFSPFLLKGNRFRVWSARHNGHTVIDVLKMLFAQPAFPVTMEMLQSDISFHEITPGQALEFGDVTVKTALLRHPGGVTGYRFEYQGKVFVHCSDWEHPEDRSLDPVLIELARDADVLSIDATYTEDEYAGRSGPSRKGWGHATHEEALRHGLAAGAKQVLLANDLVDIARAQAFRQRLPGAFRRVGEQRIRHGLVPFSLVAAAAAARNATV